MSPTAALVLVLTLLLILGALAAWLLNVPIWAIAGGVAVGGLVIRGVFRRLSKGGDRQDTEGRVRGS